MDGLMGLRRPSLPARSRPHRSRVKAKASALSGGLDPLPRASWERA